ncbi:MAG: recombination mediator RecR [Candidatus Kerfeldbacteria bacterium]
MSGLPRPLRDLVETFRKFPGVGEKSAQRYAFYLIRQSPKDLERLSAMISALPTAVVRCEVCGMIDESSPCRIDRDHNRDRSILCVVAETTDVAVIEQSGEFHGRYHVLGGVLNPIEGQTPDTLNIAPLVARIRKEKIREVIIATNPDMEGETTALHLRKIIEPTHVTVSRLGKGLPMGATLEYADEVTVANALKGRLRV